MPLELGDHPALVLPALRLVGKVLEEPLDHGQRRSPNGPRQPLRDLLAQHAVGGQPYGVEIARLFQPRIDRRDRVGGIRPEEAASKVAASVAGDDRIEDIPPAISAVDVAIAQGTASSMPNWLNKKFG